jgi:hypothetical protein
MEIVYTALTLMALYCLGFMIARWMNPVRYKTPCSFCGSVRRETQVTGPAGEKTEYCGGCGRYRGGYKHDGVFRKHEGRGARAPKPFYLVL